MAYEQMNRPETYGDVFGQEVGEDLARKPIVREDAAAMQSAENQVLGQTPRGGAASLMQSAADRSINRGVLSPDAGSQVQPPGMTVVARTTGKGGEVLETEYVQGVPVAAGRVVLEAADAPPDPRLYTDTRHLGGGGAGLGGFDIDLPGGMPLGETIGEVLETAGIQRSDKELTVADARAIQSAVARATGQQNLPGGPAAMAQSAAGTGVKLGDVLQDVTDRLPSDKLATQEDAAAVLSAEQRSNQGRAVPGGVAASVQQAADFNRFIGAV